MKIVIGSDHSGFELKEIMKQYLQKKGYDVLDIGTNDTSHSVDYPDYGRKAAEAVVSKEVDRGIVICGTGIGISIAANKVEGIRCALCTNEYMARMSRMHNDADMLSLGARVIGTDLAISILDVWLTTDFEGGRHQGRINKISEIEIKNKNKDKEE